MSIGSGKPFESVIVSLPEKGERTNPCSEIVAFSRVKDISALATCGTKNGIILEKLKKIGIGSSYIKIKQFYKSLMIKLFSLAELLKIILLNCIVLKKIKNKHFWVDATLYCNGILAELKN